MYKLKNAYQDNPHISKKKGGGGKKLYDKTGKNRRISIPPTSALSGANTAINMSGPSPKLLMEEEKSDLTVESSPHNVYLLSAMSAMPRPGDAIDQQQSVRV